MQCFSTTCVLITFVALNICNGCSDVSCPENTNRVTERNKSGKVRRYCVDQIGRKQGPSLQRNENGEKYEEYFVDNKRDGRWKSWWPNGQIKGEGKWDSGQFLKKEGMWRNWHSNSQLEKEIEYKNDTIIWSRPNVKGEPLGSMRWNSDGRIERDPLFRRFEKWSGQRTIPLSPEKNPLPKRKQLK